MFLAWLYFGGTLFFYLSALLGVYPLYLLCAVLYFGGSLALLLFLFLLYPQRVVTSPVFGSALSARGNGNCYFYRKTDRFGMQSDDSKICVVMVGLPARGKSLIAGKGMFLSVLSKQQLTLFQRCAISLGLAYQRVSSMSAAIVVTRALPSLPPSSSIATTRRVRR